MPSTWSAGDGVRLPRAPYSPPSALVGAALALLAGSIACGVINPSSSLTPPGPSPTVERATPSSMEPAAGICAEATGSIVTIALHPDVPDPRCVIVRPDQSLEILNDRDAARSVSIGRFQFEILAGGSFLLEHAFGSFLAPGVHRVQVHPCCGPELWLKAP